jgi:anti-anti-sigma factor
MKVTKKNQNGIQIVEVHGRIDPSTTASFEQELNSIISKPEVRIVLNMQNVEYISSSGLRVFLTALKKVKAGKGDLKLCCLNSNVQKIFQIAGFVQLFEILNTEEEAVQKL